MAKKNKIKVWLVNPATGYHYTTHKQLKSEKAAVKLKKKKYDPTIRKHVEFTEQKIRNKAN